MQCEQLTHTLNMTLRNTQHIGAEGAEEKFSQVTWKAGMSRILHWPGSPAHRPRLRHIIVRQLRMLFLHTYPAPQVTWKGRRWGGPLMRPSPSPHNTDLGAFSARNATLFTIRASSGADRSSAQRLSSDGATPLHDRRALYHPALVGGCMPQASRW